MINETTFQQGDKLSDLLRKVLFVLNSSSPSDVTAYKTNDSDYHVSRKILLQIVNLTSATGNSVTYRVDDQIWDIWRKILNALNQGAPIPFPFSQGDTTTVLSRKILQALNSINSLVAGATIPAQGDSVWSYWRKILLVLGTFPLSSNLIPPGSSYGPGPTPEFDLTVLPNKYYQITWGSNDLSVNICGTVYPSTGAGTVLVVNTGACSLMRFFGSFAGTTVTVVVKPVPNPVPTPTNFTWTFNSGTGNSTATWDAPPAGVFSTEVWTSSDNVTYTLAATVNSPGTSAVISGPATNQVLYAKIRWTEKVFPGFSAFTSSLSVLNLDQVVIDWAAQVITNGGAAVSNNTKIAFSVFVTTLKNAAVWTKVLMFNGIAPDNLTAALTPLVKGTGGNALWVNHNLVAGDLTINGLTGNGTNKYADTGVIGNTVGQTNTSAGMGYYVAVDNATGLQEDFGAYGLQTNAFSGVDSHYNNTLNAAGLFRFDAGGLVTWTPPGNPAGFYSLQRTSGTRLDIYFSNSGQAHSSLANNTTTPVGAPELVQPFYFLAVNNNGTASDFSRKTLSTAHVTQGLSSADDKTFGDACQALRVALGGGYV